MTNYRMFLQAFTGDLKWEEIPSLPGHFSVSPDKGDFKRVFSADVKKRQFGEVLLGVIGIYFVQDAVWSGKLGLSAYITNFCDFMDPPVLNSPKAISDWAAKIAEGVYSLPQSEMSMLEGVKLDRLGRYDLNIFVETTPWGTEFIRQVAARVREGSDRIGRG